MKILSIDPAASCGWCLVDNGVYISGGTEKFSYPTAKQQREGIPKGKKWLDFRKWFISKIDELSPDLITVEDVKRHSSTLAGHSYGFFRYDIEATCCERNIRFHPIHVGEWKKWTTGKGNATKEMVQEHLDKRLPGIVWESDDHSDATAMALYIANSTKI